MAVSKYDFTTEYSALKMFARVLEHSFEVCETLDRYSPRARVERNHKDGIASRSTDLSWRVFLSSRGHGNKCETRIG